MKSIVNNVFGMATVVACLGLVLSRPAGAEDKDKPQEVKKQARVIVVQADSEKDIAAAVKKALDEQGKGLSKEIREKIEQKLRGVHIHQPLKIHAQKVLSAKDTEERSGERPKVIVVKADGEKGEARVEIQAKAYVVESDGKTRTIRVVFPDGDEKKLNLNVLREELLKKAGDAAGKRAHAIRIVAEKKAEAESKAKEAQKHVARAKKMLEAKAKQIAEARKKAGGPEKAIAIAVAVDGDEASKRETKQFTVKIEDGKVFLNGKPVADVKGAGAREIRVQVRKEGDGKDGDADGPKVARRKMMFMGKDGEVQEFELDIDIDDVVVGTTDKHKPHVVIRRHQEGKAGDQPKQIHVRTLRLGQDESSTTDDIIAFQSRAHVDKAHAEVTKRLRGIESELKKIRQLLEKMHEDEDDDDHEEEEEEDDEEDEGEDEDDDEDDDEEDED